MKKTLILMMFSLLSLFSCKGYKDLTVNEFESMLSQDQTAQLVDVRTPEEFAENHLPGAINMDWRGEAFTEKSQNQLAKDRPVMVYCRSGRRSAEAAATLDGMGFKTYNMKGGIIAWTEAGKRVTKYEVERFWTASGAPVELTLIKHGTLAIGYKDKTIHIDPVAGYGKPTDYATEFPKADVILITHEHGDHLDPDAIAALTGPQTEIILNEKSRNQMSRGEAMHNGETRELPGGIQLEAVPAYNTTPGREMFHPKGNGNGYVFTIDGLKIYVAGDTEDVPEMANLKDIDVALLPVNQPYTMTPEQCISAAQVVGPKTLIPYHFGKTDLEPVLKALPEMDIRIRQMQ